MTFHKILCTGGKTGYLWLFYGYAYIYRHYGLKWLYGAYTRSQGHI